MYVCVVFESNCEYNLQIMVYSCLTVSCDGHVCKSNMYDNHTIRLMRLIAIMLFVTLEDSWLTRIRNIGPLLKICDKIIILT